MDHTIADNSWDPPKAADSPLEALHWKLQTSIHQIEFHNDTVFGYGKVEQVRLKVFPENSNQIGPAVWLRQVKLSGRWIVFIK